MVNLMINLMILNEPSRVKELHWCRTEIKMKKNEITRKPYTKNVQFHKDYG